MIGITKKEEVLEETAAPLFTKLAQAKEKACSP
jgi:hypothetical protein